MKVEKKNQLLDLVLKVYRNDLEQVQTDLKARLASQTITKQTSTKFTPPEGVEPIVVVKDLVKSYKNGRERVMAVDKANLELYPGELVAITGASGSGKSTLLHLIGGLDKPTSGEIIINQQKLAKMSDRKLSQFRNQTIGFVFQFFYLQPFLTLAQNIAVPSMIFSMKTKERQARTKELAEAVGLSDRLTHLPKELSGGQMQRAAIARALFNKPKILIADEPTGNLDSKNSQAIIDLFKQVRTQFNTTIVMVTHDQQIAAQADRQIVMKDGKIL